MSSFSYVSSEIPPEKILMFHIMFTRVSFDAIKVNENLIRTKPNCDSSGNARCYIRFSGAFFPSHLFPWNSGKKHSVFILRLYLVSLPPLFENDLAKYTHTPRKCIIKEECAWEEKNRIQLYAFNQSTCTYAIHICNQKWVQNASFLTARQAGL